MVRTWVRAVGAALVAAAIIGAGQLGIAYGLGILRWQQHFGDGGENGWSAHLTWAAFIAALAVVGGAAAGASSLRRHGVRDGLGGWMAVALAAALGGAITVPLVVHPAGLAAVNAALNPPLQAGITTTVGLLIGVFAAPAVLGARPIAASVLVTAVWAWALALVSAYRQISPGTMPSGVRLGVLDTPDLVKYGDNLTVLVMVTVALLAAAAIAGYARWLGERPIAVATSGAAGPAVLAAAYLVAGRGVTTAETDQLMPYLAALVAVGAGLVTSALVALIRRGKPPADDRTERVAGRPEPEPDQAMPPRAVATAAVPPLGAQDAEYASWLSRLGDADGDDETLAGGTTRRRRYAEPDDSTEHTQYPPDPRFAQSYPARGSGLFD